jgi:hypothetical protein
MQQKARNSYMRKQPNAEYSYETKPNQSSIQVSPYYKINIDYISYPLPQDINLYIFLNYPIVPMSAQIIMVLNLLKFSSNSPSRSTYPTDHHSSPPLSLGSDIS